MLSVRKQITILIRAINVVLTDGCDAISSDGMCFTYSTSNDIDWNDSRQECISRGYNLATVRSLEENTLMYSTVTDSDSCWIGLNDIDTEGTYVWTDGSDSNYTFWGDGEPNNGNDEDCVHLTGPKWNDLRCTTKLKCYFCGAEGSILINYIMTKYPNIISVNITLNIIH